MRIRNLVTHPHRYRPSNATIAIVIFLALVTSSVMVFVPRVNAAVDPQTFDATVQGNKSADIAWGLTRLENLSDVPNDDISPTPATLDEADGAEGTDANGTYLTIAPSPQSVGELRFYEPAYLDYAHVRDTYIDTLSWADDSAYLSSVTQRVIDATGSYGDSTGYAIVGDIDLCRVTVLVNDGGRWGVAYTWNSHMGHHTFTGNWSIVHKMPCNWDDRFFGLGYNDWSCCYIESYSDTNIGDHLRYIEGKGYEDCQAIHSTGYTETGYLNSGCIGLPYDQAKWVYDTCPNGTWVIVF